MTHFVQPDGPRRGVGVRGVRRRRRRRSSTGSDRGGRRALRRAAARTPRSARRWAWGFGRRGWRPGLRAAAVAGAGASVWGGQSSAWLPGTPPCETKRTSLAMILCGSLASYRRNSGAGTEMPGQLRNLFSGRTRRSIKRSRSFVAERSIQQYARQRTIRWPDRPAPRRCERRWRCNNRPAGPPRRPRWGLRRRR